LCARRRWHPVTPAHRQEAVMAKNEVPVKKSETLVDEINRLQQTVRQRAYELFQNANGWTGALENWLKAENELAAKPPIELRQKNRAVDARGGAPRIAA